MTTMTISSTTSDILVLDRAGFRAWLESNHASAQFCWVAVDRTKDPVGPLPYVDAVEEALCFGWIDSTVRTDAVHGTIQRFSPRKGPRWTELNKARCERLERLGLMTDAGRAVLPDMEFIIDDTIRGEISSDPVMLENFRSMPNLYLRVRIGNIQIKRDDPETYRRRLDTFLRDLRENRIVGNWNDGGRLL